MINSPFYDKIIKKLVGIQGELHMKQKKKNRKPAIRVVIAVVLIIISMFLWIAIDIIRMAVIKDAPRRNNNLDTGGVNRLLWVFRNKMLVNDGIPYTYATLTDEIIYKEIQGSAEYIKNRFDCSDFRALNLLELYLEGGEELIALSERSAALIKETLTGFKFWLTSPGKDSMCYHSENHEALFGALEYVIGQTFPGDVFSNDGKSGTEHTAIAKTRLTEWMDLRFTYGFSEYFSSNYYPVDIGAMSFLLKYIKNDEPFKTRAKMILDLLFYDIASQLYDGTFLSANGRAYDRNNAGAYKANEISEIIKTVWEGGVEASSKLGGFDSTFYHMYTSTDAGGQPLYRVPEVILEIGRDKEKTVKASYGLNVSELEGENLIGLSDRQMMFTLGMGAKAEPELIDNMMNFMDKNNLWGNNFLSAFKYLNITLLRKTKLLAPIIDALDPVMNGSSIQRGNLYTYITEQYKLSVNQSYMPGRYGDQNTLSIVTLPGGVTVYTTHPAQDLKFGTTPGYWAGYGVAPDANAYRNVYISLYDIPEKKLFLAAGPTPQYTHTLFPEEMFDEVVLDGKYAFGRKEGAYIALIGNNELKYRPYDESSKNSLELPVSDSTKRFDLVQEGNRQFWIYELGGGNGETFQGFMERIKGNTISYHPDTQSIQYNSQGISYDKIYGGAFQVGGVVQNTEYKRFESEYITAERKAETFFFSHNGYTLTLNFKNSARQEGAE